jgi:hypothetical protein
MVSACVSHLPRPWSGRRHAPSSVNGNRSIRPATECPAAVCLETGGRRVSFFEGREPLFETGRERPGSGPRPLPRPRGCPISSRSQGMMRRSPGRARGRPPRLRARARRDLDQHVERVARPRRRSSRGPLAPVVGWRALRGAPELAQPAGMVSARQALRRTSNAVPPPADVAPVLARGRRHHSGWRSLHRRGGFRRGLAYARPLRPRAISPRSRATKSVSSGSRSLGRTSRSTLTEAAASRPADSRQSHTATMHRHEGCSAHDIFKQRLVDAGRIA